MGCIPYGPLQAISPWSEEIMRNKRYVHERADGGYEAWNDAAWRVATEVMGKTLPQLAGQVAGYISQRKIMPGGRYLYAAGRRFPQINNCFLFKVEDTREDWARLSHDCVSALMTGGGVGVVYSALRGENQVVKGMGGTSTGPCALMQIINESGRYIMQGGSRRSALWAGLHWNHPDIFKFITLKNWPVEVRALKDKDFNFPAAMDGTNISVILDDVFFTAYRDTAHADHALAHAVYWAVVRSMKKTGEPGLSVDTGANSGQCLRNACTEVVSGTDGDMCNLASLNMARFEDIDDFTEAVYAGCALLLCGTLYSALPLSRMAKIREENRRIGLGLMGIHEWLLRRGYPYGPNDELGRWMERYQLARLYANHLADGLGLARPVATRSIAPTGTISIAAETTSGIEPVYATAYLRRYLSGNTWNERYVVDATARRLIQAGVDPSLIEDAYDLAEDVERRVNFQAWMQRHVDQGISSTINLPAWGSSVNNENNVRAFGDCLMDHLPHVRGITAYPDGARGGQPLNKVPYATAVRHLCGGSAEERETSADACKSGVCGA